MNTETPETDQAIYQSRSFLSHDKAREIIDTSRKIEIERDKALRRVARLEAALETLINLHDGLEYGGKGITGEDWEIAGYALSSENDKMEQPPLTKNDENR